MNDEADFKTQVAIAESLLAIGESLRYIKTILVVQQERISKLEEIVLTAFGPKV